MAMPISASLSAVAELTPTRDEFFITITMDEGERYKFGKITIVSEAERPGCRSRCMTIVKTECRRVVQRDRR